MEKRDEYLLIALAIPVSFAISYLLYQNISCVTCPLIGNCYSNLISQVKI
jgi:hypothetical protein